MNTARIDAIEDHAYGAWYDAHCAWLRGYESAMDLLLRRAHVIECAIDESSYPGVLAAMLEDSARLVAVQLMDLHASYLRATGHEHDDMRRAVRDLKALFPTKGNEL